MMKPVKLNLKSFSAFTLAICMLLSVFCIPAGASDEVIYTIEDEEHLGSGADFSASVNDDALENYIRQKLINSPTEIDISSFNVPESDAYALSALIYDNIPEAFHVNTLSYSVGSGEIRVLYFTYTCTPSQYTVMYNDCMESVDKILAGIKNNSALNDVQKALLVHDRLAVLCEYDTLNLELGTIPPESFTMYGALVKKIAVCQGYAEAYEFILELIGIDCELCESDTLNHAWNIVEIGGEEYHVDVTWDDVTNDITGRVNHNNFLLSTDGIYNSGHTAYDYDDDPDDTRYDNAFWRDSTAEFQLIGNEIYYVDNKAEKVKRYSDNSVVFDVDAIWYADGGRYWTDNFTRLSSDGTDLLFSKPDGVYKYDISANTQTPVWQPVMPSGGVFSVYGFTLADGYLICDIYNTPAFTLSTKTDYQQRKLYESPVTPPPPAATLVGIEVEYAPVRTEYYIGDSLDTAGLSLKLTYSDNSTDTVADGYTVSGFDSSSAGQKTVTVSYEGFNTAFNVNVKTPSITLDVNNMSLKIGGTHTLTVTTEPSGQSVAFSSIGGVVSVSSNGVVTGVSEGEAYITASFVYNGNSYSANCHVTVGCHHDSVTTYNAVESTCISHGHGRYVVCNVCEEVIEGTGEKLPFAPHEYTENATNEYLVSGATCQSPAVYNESCSFCGKRGSAEFTSGEKADHIPEAVYGKPATCVETGLTDGVKCSVCDKVLTAQTEIPLAEHDYVSQVTAPDCSNEGYTTYTCSVCGDSYKSDYTPASGDHSAENGKCAFCSAFIVEEGFTVVLSFSSAQALNDVEWKMKDEANAVVASTEVNVYDSEEQGKTIYEYVAVIEGVSAGETEVYVAISGLNLAKETIIVTPHSNHVPVVVNGYAATCTAAGLTDGEKCSFCDEVLVPQQEIPANGHCPGDWEIIIIPGLTVEGELYKKCTVCGELVDHKINDTTTEKPDETTMPDNPPVLKGDVNGDGKLTAMDARLVLRIAARLDTPDEIQTIAADFDSSGKITASDARLVLRKAAKLD